MPHHRSRLPRLGRGPPVPPDDDRALIVARWRTTHCLSAPDVHLLTVYAAADGVTFDAALLELRRRAEHI